MEFFTSYILLGGIFALVTFFYALVYFLRQAARKPIFTSDRIDPMDVVMFTGAFPVVVFMLWPLALVFSLVYLLIHLVGLVAENNRQKAETEKPKRKRNNPVARDEEKIEPIEIIESIRATKK